MARKGQFKKGGGRVGSSSRRRSRSTTAIVVAAPRAPRRRAPRRVARTHRRRSARRGGPKMNLLHLGLATAALGFVAGGKSPVKQIPEFGAKIPGAKTFGVPAVIGIGALAADRFVKPNKWLKLLGAAGIVLAAAKIGEQGTDFKFVGDDDDIADLDDVGDDDDLADLDDGDDVGDGLDY